MMGNVAPPANEVTCYTREGNGAGFAKLDSLKVPLALHTLGAIRASDVSSKAGISDSRTARCSERLNYNHNGIRVNIGRRVVLICS